MEHTSCTSLQGKGFIYLIGEVNVSSLTRSHDIGPDNQLSCLKNVGSPVCAFQITMFFKQHKYIEEMFVYNCVNNDF